MWYKKIQNKRIKLFLPSFCFPLVIDQLAKLYALLYLQNDKPVELLWGFLRFEFIFNPNGFLGILTHSPDIVKVFVLYFSVAVFVFIGSLFVLKSEKIDTRQQFFLTVVLSGGFSNFLDRLIHKQGVIDFLQFSLGPLQSGICNPADLFIFFGSGALGYLAFYKI